MNLTALKELTFDHTTKGLPYGAQVSSVEIALQHWNVLKGDLPFPLMTLKESALEHNLQAMADWCAANNFLLAPHGKTTMCPQIFARQFDHGAWAMTVASVSQAMVCLNFGVKRIVIANQIVGASNLRSLAAAINSYSFVEFYCLVDSVASVKHLSDGLKHYGAGRSINVLVEWGHNGWRTGVRSEADGLAVMAEAAKHPILKVCGVEAFEGLASAPTRDEEARMVDDVLHGLGKLADRLREQWSGDELPLFSVGGSAFLDQVQQMAKPLTEKFRVVIRSGCYVTHDHGMYDRKHAAALARSNNTVPEFKPAMELWSYVQSIPEAKRAYLTFGKRDCAYCADMPIPLFTLSEGETLGAARPMPNAKVVALNDQHAYLDLSGEENLKVGDLVCCGISHPCLAFDKWRSIPVVNDDYEVVDLYHTFF
jgi:D-serine dehydratase